jgi:arylsulfatase A-like enzyme
MQWPAQLPAGVTYEHPVSTLDLFPTFAALAGAETPENLDGVNLMPYITGKKKDIPHETLYWRMISKSGLRHGDWKLIRFDDRPTAIYNLADDPYERHNLMDSLPETLNELEALYREWDADNIPSIIPNPQRKDYQEARRLMNLGIDYRVVPPEERDGNK